MTQGRNCVCKINFPVCSRMNRPRMFKLAALLCVLALSVAAFAQEQGRQTPERWRNLVIDQSTPDDAMRTFGRPVSDQFEDFKPYPLNKWINTTGKSFRQLRYKNSPGLGSVRLVFTANLLVAVMLDPDKRTPATVIANSYGIEFEPKLNGIDASAVSSQTEQRASQLEPQSYPPNYFLLGTTSKVWIVFGIDNSSAASLSPSPSNTTGARAFPGKAMSMLILSRSLDSRVGSGVLK